MFGLGTLKVLEKHGGHTLYCSHFISSLSLFSLSVSDGSTGPVPVPIQSSAQPRQHQGERLGSSSQGHKWDHGVHVRPV